MYTTFEIWRKKGNLKFVSLYKYTYWYGIRIGLCYTTYKNAITGGNVPCGKYFKYVQKTVFKHSYQPEINLISQVWVYGNIISIEKHT